MHKSLLSAALAAGALLGALPAHAVPAVVAGTAGHPGASVPMHPGAAPMLGYPGQAVLVQPAPPAPLYEASPAPRAGYLWNPGHYDWRNGQYVWVPGEWLATRSGFGWRPGQWEQRADGSWQFVAGHWVRADNLALTEGDRFARGPLGDRDGDGIANRDDRYPGDPRRY